MSIVVNSLVRDKVVLAPLDGKSIREHLNTCGLNNIRTVDVFSSISSTNDYLLNNELAKREVSVCVAEQQTRGRGRYGHHWESPSAVNLYLSMSWPLLAWKEEYEPLGLWFLIAIAEQLESQGFSDIQLKWPNDICVGNKKLAGILIERKISQTKNALVIGVGLNVAMSLKDDVKIETPWIDLLSIKPDWQLSRNELAANVVLALYTTLSKLEQDRLIDLGSKWNRYDTLLNQQVEFFYKEKIEIGCVRGIDEHGKIILDIGGKLEHLHSTHVSEIKLIGN